MSIFFNDASWIEELKQLNSSNGCFYCSISTNKISELKEIYLIFYVFFTSKALRLQYNRRTFLDLHRETKKLFSAKLSAKRI